MTSRHPFGVLAIVLVCAAPAGVAALGHRERPGLPHADQSQAQPPGDQKTADRPQQRRWMWWRVAESKTELAITDQQASEIDEIFQSNVPALREAKEELDKLDAEVAQVIKPGTADVATVSRIVGRAERARAKLTTTRTVMFYRMHRVLSPEQRVKLNAMFERWDAERRKTTDSTRR